MAPTVTAKEESVDPWANHKLPEGAETLDLGVNRVIYQSLPRLAFALPGRNLVQERVGTFTRTLPSVRWLFGELYTISPLSFVTLLSMNVLLHLQPIVRLYLNHRVLSMVRLRWLLSLSCAHPSPRR
jgi:hypothetical protein